MPDKPLPWPYQQKENRDRDAELKVKEEMLWREVYADLKVDDKDAPRLTEIRALNLAEITISLEEGAPVHLP